jgi:opacity protein-like surface antigen
MSERKTSIKISEVKILKRTLFLALAVSLFMVASSAFAADISPKVYNKTAPHNDFSYYSQGQDRGYDFSGFTTSTHLYGTWNNPFKAGLDAYNYNDAQGYAKLGQGGILFVWGESISQILQQMGITGNMQKMYFPYVMPAGYDPSTGQNLGQGPHGGYATTTHKCRDCHAVHRAAGKFKLLRADSRTEACDWCHGQGAGSGYNIQMDNDEANGTEYNVGHTLGFGNSEGKYKAPDDTYPAYTPKYYMGGFSCMDCHSPHGNPQRMLGYIDMGRMMNKPGLQPNMFPDAPGTDGMFVKVGMQAPGFISNPGAVDHNAFMYVPWPLNERRPSYEVTMPLMYPDMQGGYVTVNASVLNVGAAMNQPWLKSKSIFAGGRWLLIENPDVEIVNGVEIPDYSTQTVTFPGDGNSYVVNKTKTNWDWPYGSVSEDDLLGDSAGKFINPI